MKYFYRGLNENLQTQNGFIFAANRSALQIQLKKTGIDLLLAIPVGRETIDPQELINFCQTLLMYEETGLPLLEAIKSIKTQGLQGLESALQEGQSLSQALEKFPHIFDPIFLSFIRLGEATGKMGPALQQLISHLEWTKEIKKHFIHILRYPLITLGFFMLALLSLMIFLVFPMGEFLKSLDQDLPLPTRLLISISQGEGWWIFIPFVGLLVLMIKKRYIPFVGPLQRHIEQVRFIHIFTLLSREGFDALKALEITIPLLKDKTLNQKLLSVKEDIVKGEELSLSFEKRKVLDETYLSLLRHSEKTGKFYNILQQIDTHMQQNLQNRIKKGLAFLEPLLLSTVGLFVLWIAISVFFPLYDSLTLIDQQ